MSGWKKWQPLEFVDADDFQSYLQDQVVQVYANSSARSSALGTSVSAGMLSYLTGSTVVEFYNGSAWVNVSASSGDITSVMAGTGLTGGGTGGDVTLNVNYSAVGSAVLASPTITGTATIAAGTVTGNFGVGGTVTLPTTTSIGSVSSTEIAYLDGVTSALQTQLDGKAASNASITINGTAVALGGTVTVGDITAVTAGTGLTGGGTGGDVTLNVNYAAVGTAITIAQSQVTNLVSDLAAKAAGTAGITINSTFVALGGTATISGGAAGDDDQIILPVQIFS